MLVPIQVSAEVKDYIEAQAKFPESTHDQVLRRLFGVRVESRSPKKEWRANSNAPEEKQMTPQRAFREFILGTLLASKTYAVLRKEILQQVRLATDPNTVLAHQASTALARLASSISLLDCTRNDGGVVRWEKILDTARFRLANEEGLLCPVYEGVDYGNWKLTPKGVREAERLEGLAT